MVQCHCLAGCRPGAGTECVARGVQMLGHQSHRAWSAWGPPRRGEGLRRGGTIPVPLGVTCARQADGGGERGEGIPAPGAADEPGAEGAIGASLFASRAVGKESSSAG